MVIYIDCIFMTVTFKSIRITFLCKGIGAVTDRKK